MQSEFSRQQHFHSSQRAEDISYAVHNSWDTSERSFVALWRDRAVPHLPQQHNACPQLLYVASDNHCVLCNIWLLSTLAEHVLLSTIRPNNFFLTRVLLLLLCCCGLHRQQPCLAERSASVLALAPVRQAAPASR